MRRVQPLSIRAVRIALGGFVWMLVMRTGFVRAQANEARLERVVDAWASRQERVKSFDVAARGTWGMKLSPGFGLAPGADPQKLFPRPPSDTTYVAEVRLTTDVRGRVRDEFDQIWWAVPDGLLGVFRPHKVISIDDGKAYTDFFDVGGGVPIPNCFIYNRGKEGRGRISHMRNFAIRMVYRPFDEMGTVVRSKLKVAEENALWDGRRTVVLQHADELIWVDPEREYLPVRYQMSKSNPSRRIIEFSYKEDDIGDWVLASWKDDYAGGFRFTATMEVTSFSVNQGLPDELFAISLPPGTWVHDETTGESYIDHGTRKRHVGPGEFNGLNYKDLVERDEPQAWWWPNPLFVLGNLALILGSAAALYFIRRWRSHAAS